MLPWVPYRARWCSAPWVRLQERWLDIPQDHPSRIPGDLAGPVRGSSPGRNPRPCYLHAVLPKTCRWRHQAPSNPEPWRLQHHPGPRHPPRDKVPRRPCRASNRVRDWEACAGRAARGTLNCIALLRPKSGPRLQSPPASRMAARPYPPRCVHALRPQAPKVRGSGRRSR
jgi:hypothetical protein